jgi:solute carrier family 12 sodium/potassium/chloride transporter 2
LREKLLRSQASTLTRDMLMTMTMSGDTMIDEHIMQNLSQFRGAKQKQKEGTIDVYWLYDTGGLTLLLPFIINSRAMFAKCKLRVFVLANKDMNLEEQARSMALMLKKFRITFQQIILISDATKRPGT